MRGLFRSIITISYLSYVIWFFLPYIDRYIFNQGVIDALSWTGYGSLLPNDEYIAFSFLFLYTLFFVGLFLFKNWARLGFISLILLGFLMSILSGVVVLSPIDVILYQIVYLLDGAAIVIMYFTSVNKEFK